MRSLHTVQLSRKGPEMRHVGSGCRSDLTRLGADRPSLPLGGTGELKANRGSAGFLEFQGALPSGPQTSARAGGRRLGGWVCFGFNWSFAARRGVALCWRSLCLDSNVFSLFSSSFDLVSHCSLSSLPVSSFLPVLFVCLCFAQVASVLLQCLAALLLLGDPLGLEGCQHSVQPQPLQALWARREAKCSERVLRLPAQEDSGKPPGRGPRDPTSSSRAAMWSRANGGRLKVSNVTSPRSHGRALGAGPGLWPHRRRRSPRCCLGEAVSAAGVGSEDRVALLVRVGDTSPRREKQTGSRPRE